MKRLSLFILIIAVAPILAIVVACSLLRSNDAGNTTSTNVNSSKTGNSQTEASPRPNVEKADFNLTAEDLDKEFTRKGVTSADLAKYKNKNIAVSGRVSVLVTEKKGPVQPWVTLYAPGT